MEKIKKLAQFKGCFGINAKALKSKFSVPLVILMGEDYSLFGFNRPASDAPLVGVMFERCDDYYIVNTNLINSLAATGVRVMFLDYTNYASQMRLCDALVLAGSTFEIPEWYYTDSRGENAKPVSTQTKAYIECYNKARQRKMPILGIDAGMLIMAAEAGLKLSRQPVFPAEGTHQIELVEDTLFHKLMKSINCFDVGYGRSGALADIQKQVMFLEGKTFPLYFYAFSEEIIPEAIGKMEQGLLGVQWHPENLAVKGNKYQQRIFNWFADKAAKHHQAKQKRKP